MVQEPEQDKLLDTNPEPATIEKNYNHTVKLAIVFLLPVIIGLTILLVFVYRSQSKQTAMRSVKSFPECVEFNNGQINAIYPPQCSLPDGRVFVDPSAKPLDENINIPSFASSPFDSINLPDITNWPHHLSTVANFSYQYPPDWKVEARTASENIEDPAMPAKKFQIQERAVPPGINSVHEALLANVEYENSSTANIFTNSNPQIIAQKEVIIDQVSGYQIDVSYFAPEQSDSITPKGIARWIAIPYKDKTYLLVNIATLDPEIMAMFNAFVSTLDLSSISSPLTASPGPTSSATFEEYKNLSAGYLIRVPANWQHDDRSDSDSFRSADNNFDLVVQTIDSQAATIQDYLQQQDTQAQTGWKGTPSYTVISTQTSKIGDYSVVQRQESWHAAAFAKPVLATYFQDPQTKTIYQITLRYLGNDQHADYPEAFNSIIQSFQLL